MHELEISMNWIVFQPLDYEDGTLLNHLFLHLMRNKISGYFFDSNKKVGLKLKVIFLALVQKCATLVVNSFSIPVVEWLINWRTA